jgi:DNA-binding transcriptional ArsR family regulator
MLQTLLIIQLVSGLAQPVTLYSIYLSEDGSSQWIVEQRFPLSEAESELLVNISEALTGRAVEYRSRLEYVVREAAKAVGREMRIEDLQVETQVVETIGGKIGLIRVSFVWRGFDKTDQPCTAVVGDVFVGGLYLADGETLRIYVPEGYQVAEARPKPDEKGERYVGWAGRRVFPDGEPRLAISRYALGSGDQPPWAGEMLYLLAALPGLVGGVALIVYRIRRRAAGRVARKSDAEAILEVLRRHGGAAYQAQIVKECGLPKSTVSTVLKILEAEGRVVRERVGRENLVRIVD